MADVFGVPPIDPNDFSNSTQIVESKSILALVSNTDKMVAYLKDIDKSTTQIANKVLGNLKSTSEKSQQRNTKDNTYWLAVETNRNTQALIGLSEQIKTATVSVEISGPGSNFFTRFLAISTNEKKVKAVDSFGKVFGSTIERLAKVSDSAEKIEKLGKALFVLFSSTKEIGKGLALASAGLALFGFTVLTFMEAITWEDMFKFVGLMTAIRVGSEIIGKAKWNFALSAAGIALLGLSINAFNELITVDEAFNFGKNLLIIGGAVGAYSLIANTVAKSSKNILISSAAIAAVAASSWIFNKAVSNFDDVDLLRVGQTGLAIGGLSLVFGLMGSQAINVGKGAIAAIAVSAGLFALSFGLNKILSIPKSNLENATDVGLASIAAIGVLALIGASGPVAIAIGVGALAAAGVGLALGALALGLNSITSVKITEEQAENFSQAIKYAASGLMTLANPLLVAGLALATPAAIALTASTLGISGAIWAISKLPKVEPSKFQNFGLGVHALIDTFSNIGFRKLAKAGLSVVLVTPIATISVLLAGVLRLYSALSVNPDKIQTAMDSTKIFVDSLSNIFDSNKKKLDSVRVGINSFLKISSLSKSIADVVNEIGNLEFSERKIVNGQSVIVSTRKLTPKDFDSVGKSIGRMLSALTDPLAKIGDQKDTYKIGGFTVTNPFSNKVKNGIESMTNIGKVFTPLSDIVKTFSNNNISTNFIVSFNRNLSTLLGGIGTAFVDNETNLRKASKIKTAEITATVASLSTSLSNKGFNENVINFGKFSKDLVLVKDTLNGMDIMKLTKFTNMISHLNEMSKLGAIKELVEVFTQFLDKFTTFIEDNKNEETQQAYVQQTQQQTGLVSSLQPLSRTLPVPQTKIDPDKFTKEDITKLIQSMEQLKRLFIDGTAKVKLVDNIY